MSFQVKEQIQIAINDANREKKNICIYIYNKNKNEYRNWNKSRSARFYSV